MQYAQNVKIGLVARCDDSGLGVMTFDFFRNFIVEKVLIVSSAYKGYPDRYDGYELTKTRVCQMGTPTLEDIDWLLEDMDMVVTIETPYNWNIYSRAKEKGVKSVLITMYEWTPKKAFIPTEPDLYLCPSTVDFESIEGENKVYLPTPVNRKLVPFKQRDQAKTFIFNNGHGGWGGRNSISEFFQALPFVKSDVKFKVRSQVPFDGAVNDSRVEVFEGEMNYEQLWQEGDIYIHLHKFDGLSLPLNEALSAGFPIIALDKKPHNEYLPKELLVKPLATPTIMIAGETVGREVEAAVMNPVDIAEMIDKVANMSNDEIINLSKTSDKLAESISWDALKLRYLETFHDLCNKNE